ncbi:MULTISPECIES: hypothetical protein [Streptomyces]|uniref:hypothetical protein n=1 Tax=Streptomyces TaxID=1883 RepID=UPI000FB9ED71|nr:MULTISPECIES: hypothetical protein [Streptomyces]RPK81258.1 hypothetical protein EES46_29475 [Streptomyces sp. ADI98-10]
MTYSSIPLPFLLAVAAVAAIYLSVVLPAVWSRKPARRAAALKVLTQLLEAVRHRRAR